MERIVGVRLIPACDEEVVGRGDGWAGGPCEENRKDGEGVEQAAAGDNEGEGDEREVNEGVPWPI